MAKITARTVSDNLRALANPEIAQHSQRFFKTGKGEYGEGDEFLGIRVPVIREQVKKYGKEINLDQIQQLLSSVLHEERLCALLLWVYKFKKGDEQEKTAIYEAYLSNTQYINNWDLVDSSAYHIVGAYLSKRDRKILYELAESTDLWQRRIAIMSTFFFIRNKEFDDTLRLAKSLLHDQEDLMHKAVGWMLREVGKRDLATEKQFLNTHYQQMPRTMLRYAIEKFSEQERQQYLQGKI